MAAVLPSDVPRIRQTLRLPDSRLESLREWATEGTALTAATRVRDPPGRIALVKNSWTDGWFLPGGGVEVGESLRDAASRELREETGLDGRIGEPLVAVDQTFVSEASGTERFDALFVVFSARADGDIPPASRLGVGEEEIEAARWFDSIPDTLHDGDLLRPYL